MKPTRLFALGGMQEIGKTTIVVEYDDEIFIIDAGIKFPSSWLLGIDGIIPNYEYLKKNWKKIQALLITHSHDDHIGGIPFLLKEIPIPKIYVPKIGIEYLKNKFHDQKLKTQVQMLEIDKDSKVQSKNMTVDFYTTQHSIPDSFGIRIKTPNGTIVDTGDFRFDYTPIGNLTDFDRMKQIGDEGVDILISDSTNSMSENSSPSENEIIKDITSAILESKGLTFITTFASNLTRLNKMIQIGEEMNKKIALFGRSMIKGFEIARKIGYINIKDESIIDAKNINKYDRNEVLIFCTGSQGEEMSALNRISQSTHQNIKIKNNDTIIFSSSPIPGNRIKIEEMVNRLYKLGAKIKEHKIDGLYHTSGHAFKDEHIKTFELMKPKYFIPYHGEYRMSTTHAQTAIECNVKKENILIIKNGDVIEILNHNAKITDEYIENGPMYIDSNFVSSLTENVIAEREKMGENGFLGITMLIDRKRNSIIGRPRIISRGTFYTKDNQDVMIEAQRLVHSSTLYWIKNNKNWNVNEVKSLIEKRLQPYFYKIKRREPMIISSIIIMK